MDYFELIKKQPSDREALVEDGVSFSYGDLIRLAEGMAREWKENNICLPETVHVIKEKRICQQLISFLACFITGEIPLVAPWESEYFEKDAHLLEGQIPENACVAVATSGTTGVPKIYFRTYESWAGYFSLQNEIFGIHEDSRLFVQGSLSFTGNMNLYLAQFFAGGTVIAENEFQPRDWEERLASQGANAIYLIPAKLLLLPNLLKDKNTHIETIISGSQSLGKGDALRLKEVFPNTKIVLYYGATELNYITYVTDDMMTEQRNLIGKPFPEVEVYLEKEEIFVNTAYHVQGITCPYTLSDKGYLDAAGNLYFNGRTDDMLLYRGHKVSALKVENALEELDMVQEAAVCMGEKIRGNEKQIVAYVVLSDAHSVQEQEILAPLRKKLYQYELPRRIFQVKSLPRNTSGKVDKKQLDVLK